MPSDVVVITSIVLLKVKLGGYETGGIASFMQHCPVIKEFKSSPQMFTFIWQTRGSPLWLHTNITWKLETNGGSIKSDQYSNIWDKACPLNALVILSFDKNFKSLPGLLGSI